MITQTVQAENLNHNNLTPANNVLRERVIAAVTALGREPTRKSVRRADVCAYLQNNHADTAYKPKQVDHVLQELRKAGRLTYTSFSGWMVVGTEVAQ